LLALLDNWLGRSVAEQGYGLGNTFNPLPIGGATCAARTLRGWSSDSSVLYRQFRSHTRARTRTPAPTHVANGATCAPWPASSESSGFVFHSGFRGRWLATTGIARIGLSRCPSRFYASHPPVPQSGTRSDLKPTGVPRAWFKSAMKPAQVEVAARPCTASRFPERNRAQVHAATSGTARPGRPVPVKAPGTSAPVCHAGIRNILLNVQSCTPWLG
jgi:hypothetical protein